MDSEAQTVFGGSIQVDANAVTNAAITIEVREGAGSITLDFSNNAGETILLAASGDDILIGGGGNDTLDAGNGNNTINGGGGDDKIYSGNDDDTITLGTGADFVSMGDGADTIILGGSDGANDQVVYMNAGAGAAAGENTGYDVITGFVSGEDTICFSSTMDTGIIDDIVADNAITWNTNSSLNFATEDEAVFITLGTGASLTEQYFTTLLTTINGDYSKNADSSKDGLIVATNGTDTAFYSYTESGAGGNDVIDFSEIKLLGVVEDAVLTTGDFQIMESIPPSG